MRWAPGPLKEILLAAGLLVLVAVTGGTGRLRF
jgi:hypothetical protein